MGRKQSPQKCKPNLHIGNVPQRDCSAGKNAVKPDDFSLISEIDLCKANRCFPKILQNNMFSIQLETLVLFSHLTYQAQGIYQGIPQVSIADNNIC